ncbi:alpha/beta hydrolase [Humitalea sp. 24SJ18S-53]|uniref:alpha/beta hydrolase n=1 Tax=Humitalea sp. 24SJ18S-53 TaxID=3422307 RepID=UPI003D678E9E
MLRRRFADLGWGQVHYRTGGHGGAAPLVLLHGAAGNGQGLTRLAEALSETRLVLVPDLPGCGESDPLPDDAPDLGTFAQALIGFCDAMGLAACDVLGAHLGARVAMEMALAAPSRTRRIILDGVGFYDDAGRQEMLERVAPEIRPDPDGIYLHMAHAMCRDYFRFFPWFARDPAHRRAAPAPDPIAVHAKLLEVLKNGTTYHRAYRAAIRYRVEDRLPLVRVPALIVATRGDNVAPQAARAAALLPGAALVETPGAADLAETAAILTRFLDTPASLPQGFPNPGAET